jgi:hypothetical protein
LTALITQLRTVTDGDAQDVGAADRCSPIEHASGLESITQHDQEKCRAFLDRRGMLQPQSRHSYQTEQSWYQRESTSTACRSVIHVIAGLETSVRSAAADYQ